MVVSPVWKLPGEPLPSVKGAKFFLPVVVSPVVVVIESVQCYYYSQSNVVLIIMQD